MLIYPINRKDYKELAQCSFPRHPEFAPPYYSHDFEIKNSDYNYLLDDSRNKRARIALLVSDNLTAGNTFTLLDTSGVKVNYLTISSRRGFIGLHEKQRYQGIVRHSLVFFPERNDSRAYAIASEGSRYGGPGSKYPGCVGQLEYQIDLELKIAKIIQIQSSVKHHDPKVWEDLQGGQARNLKNYYSHWKFDLIHIAVDYFKKLGISKIWIQDPSSPGMESTDKPIPIKLLQDAIKGFSLNPLIQEEQIGHLRLRWQELRKEEKCVINQKGPKAC